MQPLPMVYYNSVLVTFFLEFIRILMKLSSIFGAYAKNRLFKQWR